MLNRFVKKKESVGDLLHPKKGFALNNFSVPSEKEIISGWGAGLKKPIISIVCHVFNHAHYLRDTLNGFLSQKTTFPFEIVINDDASSDQSREIILEYYHRYPNIIKFFFHPENLFRKGIRPTAVTFFEATGEFIALCEGDDFWCDERKIQTQCELMMRNPSINLCVHPAYKYIVSSGRLKASFYHGPSTRVLDVHEAVVSRRQFSPTAAYFMRTAACREMPDWFFRGRGLPFGDYFIEAILGVNGILYVPHFFSVYRRGVVGSHTSNFNKENINSICQKLEKTLYYTNLLNEIPGLSLSALRKRLLLIRVDFFIRAIRIGSPRLLLRVIRSFALIDNQRDV